MDNEIENSDNLKKDRNIVYMKAVFPDYSNAVQEKTEQPESDIDILSGVSVELHALAGKANITLADIMGITEGMVIRLDRHVGERTDLVINDKIIAHGDIIADMNRISVKITEIAGK